MHEASTFAVLDSFFSQKCFHAASEKTEVLFLLENVHIGEY